MFILPSAGPDAPGDIIISASDIVAADACGFAAVRRLDALLGRIDTVPAKRDAMMDLTAALGEKREREILHGLKVRYGAGVSELPVTPGASRPALERRHRDTLAALGAGYDVIYQGAFFDGAFHGRADFLIRGADGRWIVHDTKLARSAKGPALLQLAVYADQLQAAGVAVADEGRLILGDGTTTSRDLGGPAAAYRKARAHLQSLLAEHRADRGAAEFHDPRWAACLKSGCTDCEDYIAATDDLMLVRGMNRTRRTALHLAGITTLSAFAVSAQNPDADKLGRAL